MRVSGQVIWATGLVETSQTTGGGKKSGGRTTSYTYAASFAVALAGRPIRGVGRVWADGKLLRNSVGEMLTPGTMRIYPGDESQDADPLIVSAEGVDATPAYRGLAYAVFEDLQLADYANHVPSLSFEVIADEAPPSIGAIVTDVAGAAGIEALVGEVPATVPGFAVGRDTSVRAAAEALAAFAPVRVRDNGMTLCFGGDDAGVLPVDAMSDSAAREARAAADSLPGEISLSFLDIGRDYQPGLQRARRRGSARQDARDLSVALAAADAKRTAEQLLSDAWATRATAVAQLGWAQAAFQPGDRVSDAAGRPWRVRGWTMEGLGVTLELERDAGDARASVPPSDSGAALPQLDAPQGETILHVLDLPPLPGQPLPTTPRLWLAAAGTGAGWRRAEVLMSADAGATWTSVAVVGGPLAIGATVSTLGAGPCERWDRRSVIEVELLNDAMWLEGRGEASVLAGANLALVGDELVAFAGVEATGPRRFRLSTLLRGRQGTESAAATHAAGERFVLLSAGTLTPVDPPAGAIGGSLMFKAVGANDIASAVAVNTVSVTGRALRPLSPVRPRAARQADGGIYLSWTRRSRQGFDWLDGVDAPVAEERESYVISLRGDGGAPRVSESAAPWAIYSSAEQAADAGKLVSLLEVNVVQMSALVGAGSAASTTIVFG